MIIKHYYDFGKEINGKIENNNGEGLTQSDWDMLRTESGDKAFAFVEKNKESYANMCAGRKDCRNLAQEILKILEHNKGMIPSGNLVSLGCGKGILEWNLKNLKPELHIECTDYTLKGLIFLRKVFPECDKIYEFDMLNESHYQKIAGKNQVVLISRVSTEFDFQTWKRIFHELFQNRIKYIVFIPTELCTIRIAINEAKRYIYHLIKGNGKRRNIFCGYMYSEKTFEKMWKRYFAVKESKAFGDTRIYLLELSN